jgi:hypothetical protein
MLFLNELSVERPRPILGREPKIKSDREPNNVATGIFFLCSDRLSNLTGPWSPTLNEFKRVFVFLKEIKCVKTSRY